jgi:hypothetical protein
VAAARRLPDFDAINGWRAAITKEIRRVENFKAWRLATSGEVRRDRAMYGEGRVSIGYLVAVLTCKMDPAGAAREPEVVNKFRVVVADKDGVAQGVVTHSNCVDDISNRIIATIAPAIGALQDSIDVGGAYFHGSPPDMDNGGRRLYVRIPAWLAALFPEYPMRGDRGGHFLLIMGNMPGRCDAGRIWQQRFDVFLTGFGLRQLCTDRRVWTKHSSRGDLIVHDHVDDSRLTYTSVAARDDFHNAWAREFRETITSRPCSEDFTGLRHSHEFKTFTTRISCEGVIRRLEKLLVKHPLGTDACDWPLAAVAPFRLKEGPTPANPLTPELVDEAAPLLGTIGFVTGLTRPDAHFAYCLLSRYASAARLTNFAFRCIVRLGHYLVATRSLHLALTTPRRCPRPEGGTALDLFDCFVDSSNGNLDDGTSMGGFVLSSSAPPPGSDEPTGGGALAWCCKAPREGDDSSAASELRMATHGSLWPHATCSPSCGWGWRRRGPLRFTSMLRLSSTGLPVSGLTRSLAGWPCAMPCSGGGSPAVSSGLSNGVPPKTLPTASRNASPASSFSRPELACLGIGFRPSRSASQQRTLGSSKNGA